MTSRTAPSKRSRRRCSLAGERASAAVEFALVLPLVLVVALAILQVGLLVKDQLVVVGCARAGARQAAVSTNDESVRQSVVEAGASLREDRLSVQVSREGGAGNAVRVVVNYRAPVVVPLVRWLFRSEIDLSSTAWMRQEIE